MLDWLEWSSRAAPPYCSNPQGMRNVANDPESLVRQAEAFRQFAEFSAKHRQAMRRHFRESAIMKIRAQPFFG